VKRGTKSHAIKLNHNNLLHSSIAHYFTLEKNSYLIILSILINKYVSKFDSLSGILSCDILSRILKKITANKMGMKQVIWWDRFFLHRKFVFYLYPLPFFILFKEYLPDIKMLMFYGCHVCARGRLNGPSYNQSRRVRTHFDISNSMTFQDFQWPSFQCQIPGPFPQWTDIKLTRTLTRHFRSSVNTEFLYAYNRKYRSIINQ